MTPDWIPSARERPLQGPGEVCGTSKTYLREGEMRFSLRLLAWPTIAVAALVLAGTPTAYAHEGIEAGQNPWTAWNPKSPANPVLLVAAYLYVTGLGRWERPQPSGEPLQRVSFFRRAPNNILGPSDPHRRAGRTYAVLSPGTAFPPAHGRTATCPAGRALTPMLRGLPPWALLGVVKPVVRNPWARWAYYRITNPVLTTFSS